MNVSNEINDFFKGLALLFRVIFSNYPKMVLEIEMEGGKIFLEVFLQQRIQHFFINLGCRDMRGYKILTHLK